MILKLALDLDYKTLARHIKNEAGNGFLRDLIAEALAEPSPKSMEHIRLSTVEAVKSLGLEGMHMEYMEQHLSDAMPKESGIIDVHALVSPTESLLLRHSGCFFMIAASCAEVLLPDHPTEGAYFDFTAKQGGCTIRSHDLSFSHCLNFNGARVCFFENTWQTLFTNT